MIDRNELRIKIVSIYQDFYRSVTLNTDYNLPDNKLNRIAIDNFLSYLENNYETSIGLDWLIDFIELSFHWWYKREKSLKYGLQSIKLTWIIGKPSIERYENLKRDKAYAASYFRSKMRLEIGARVRDKYRKINSNKVFLNLIHKDNEFEESHKRKLYGKPEGLLWCLANTTLFRESSSLCVSCVNRTRCIDLLQKEYPNIHKARMS